MADDAARIAALEAALLAAGQREAALASELAEAREQQSATADILRLIASSPADAQPILDGIVERGMRLAGGNFAALSIDQGDYLLMVAAAVAVVWLRWQRASLSPAH